MFSRRAKEHITHLALVLDSIASFNLKLKISKCEFIKPEVVLLGHIVSVEGMKVDPAKVDEIQNISVPNSFRTFRNFSGYAGYYRIFIRSFATICAPLYGDISAKKRLVWTSEINERFEELKEATDLPPILAYPAFEMTVIVETEASKVGLGEVLA